MIKISYNDKVYHIQKEKLSHVLEKLNGTKVNEDKFLEAMEKFHLLDEYFLKHVNEL